MPARRELTMRQIRQMLRLARDGVSAREIGRRLGIARSTVHDNIGRAAAAGLVWPLGDDITDAVLEQHLFTHIGVKQGVRRRAEPDWPSLAREMRRPGVNLVVLWEEYRATQPEGYGYSRFCDLYREFERRLTPVRAPLPPPSPAPRQCTPPRRSPRPRGTSGCATVTTASRPRRVWETHRGASWP